MKVIKFLSVFIFVFLIFFIFAKNVFAEITSIQNPEIAYKNTSSINFVLTSNSGDILPNEDYTFGIWPPNHANDPTTNFPLIRVRSNSKGQLTITMSLSGSGLNEPGTWGYRVWLGKDFLPNQQSLIFSGQYWISYCENFQGSGCPSLVLYQDPLIYQATKSVEVGIRNVILGHTYSVWFDGAKKIPNITPNSQIIENGFPTYRFAINAPEIAGSYKLCMSEEKPNFWGLSFTGDVKCDFFFKTPDGNEKNILITASAPTNVSPTIIDSNQPGIPPTLIPGSAFNSTNDVPPPPCATLSPDGKCISVHTAIGLISTEPQEFVKSIFSLVLGLAGGIALILIILSGYRMMASQGNPEALTNARQQLIGTVVGLLFIIFSFVILEIIGVDILKIPGFNQ